MYFINMIFYDVIKQRYVVDRCFGYFKKFSDALDVVVNNEEDLAENGAYEYCCIELVPDGLYRRYIARRFFKYNDEQDKYESCPALPGFERRSKMSF